VQPQPEQPRLPKGEMAAAFRQLTREVFDSDGYAVDPAPLLQRLAQLPLGRDFCDGGQHDCQELLRLLMDTLHDDLNRVEKKPSFKDETEPPAEEEPAKAARHWARYLAADNSPITDLFGGQLQSTVHCHGCDHRFTMYEPFWDLSLPLAREGKGGGISAWFSGRSTATTIQDCLAVFTSEETLSGEEAFSCEVCKQRTEATKRMRLHRLPKALALHIKRFKYAGHTREKLTANVTFPLKGLKLTQFLSDEAGATDAAAASYDLYAVSNHFGSMVGGHYTAACRIDSDNGEQWYSFNDEVVQKLSPQAVVSPCAYILFYVRSDST
jgi:ubiquitin carboxyl-terminal hydrolase 2/21